jgi:hypothetical protein
MNRLARNDNDQRFFEMGVFAICDALHGSWTGASDPLCEDERDRMIGYLRHRLKMWDAGVLCAYDQSVWLLLDATLRERE